MIDPAITSEGLFIKFMPIDKKINKGYNNIN